MTPDRGTNTLLPATQDGKEIRMNDGMAQRQEKFSLGALVVSIVISNLAFFLYVAPIA
jgi:hypothetical protein